MAVTLTNILIKAGIVSIGDYVTAKGAGTLADAGATIGGISLQVKTETHVTEADQYLGELMRTPSKRTAELKFVMEESDLEKWRLMSEQPAANLTGVAPNKTLLTDADAAEQYHQIAITTKGVGTTKVRTITLWRCVIVNSEPISFKKDEEQKVAVTVAVLEEISGTGLDTLFKTVDA